MDLREIKAELCTACRACEAACSLSHYGVVNPLRSRVRVKDEGLKVEIGVCIHCQELKCIPACRRQALVESFGVLILRPELCDLCGDCVKACPSAGVHIEPLWGSVYICDLCSGDPNCVKVCAPGALSLKNGAVGRIKENC